MAKKKEQRLVIEIKGTLVWPKLSVPDVFTNKKTGKSGEPAYKTNVAPIDDDEELRVNAILAAFRLQKFEEGSECKMPIREDKEGAISYSMKRSAKLGKCPVFDAKNHKLPDDAGSPGGGSVVKVQVTVNDYDDGINLYLNAIQVLKFEEDTYGKSPFEATDGYEHDDSDASSPFGKTDDSEDDLAL